MSVYYAQINIDKKVTGISDLAGEVIQDNMIQIDSFNTDLMGLYYNSITQDFEIFDKYKLVLTTTGPYSAGITSLIFEQRDLSDVPVTVSTTFNVDINGQVQEVLVEDGTLEITLDCPEATTVVIKITGYRHQSLTQEVVISG